jgi:hypothetical protein
MHTLMLMLPCVLLTSRKETLFQFLFTQHFLRSPRGWLRFVCYFVCLLCPMHKFRRVLKSTRHSTTTKLNRFKAQVKHDRFSQTARMQKVLRSCDFLRVQNLSMRKKHASIPPFARGAKEQHACLTCVASLCFHRLSRVSACAFLERLFQPSGVFTCLAFRG